MPDYYGILGVGRDASAEDLKRAYRKLARESHPDANPDDPHAEERFKAINEAYAVLSDPEKRQRYDTFGDAGAQAGGFAGGFGGLDDIMEAFFGGSPFGGRARTRTRTSAVGGSDVAVGLRLTLEEAVFGTRKEVQLRALGRCETCNGDGCAPGTYRTKCARCGGAGEIRATRQTILGTVMTSRVCATCEGSGEAPSVPCTSCGGSGRTEQQRSVTIEIPTVRDGMTVRLRGQGEQGVRGGRDGDLFVKVRVDQHPVFEWEGDDLLCDCQVPLTQAVLGAEIEIDTLDGTKPLTIPAGTQHGTVLRLRALGVPRERGGRGDLLVHVSVDIPAKITREERELFEQLASMRGEAVSEERKGVFRRLRDSIADL